MREKMKAYDVDDLKRKIKDFPFVELISRPTPLYLLEKLGKEAEGRKVLIKRDDLTGLAFGGNKSRKLEFILADALKKGADTVVTWGALQSNWCLQLAASASKVGLRPVLLLFKSYDVPAIYEGNVFLEFLLDARIEIKESEEKGKSVNQDKALELLEELAARERAKGHRPYLVPVGGSTRGGHLDKPLGALSYFQAMLEIYEQTVRLPAPPDYVVIASGSGGTQAGLIVGAKALGLKTKVVGICVSDKKEEFLPVVKQIAFDLVNTLDLEVEIDNEDFILFDDYLGAGYGLITAEIAQTIRNIFKKEALILDPVYTAKAMLGLIDLVKRNYFSSNDRILFVHTGGTPALFAFKDYLLSCLPAH
jgi:D-cysteine desulfhydrase family pyridoxal phosphate-dependent enzyme